MNLILHSDGTGNRIGQYMDPFRSAHGRLHSRPHD